MCAVQEAVEAANDLEAEDVCVSDLNRGKKGLGGRNHSMGVWFTGMTPADARA